MAINESNSSLDQIDLSSIRHFYAVARFGGFSRAARAVHVSQPALSLGVQRLERSLGVTLIHRQGREAETTDAGKRLFEFCQQLEGDLEKAILQMGVERRGFSRRIRIGTALSIGFRPLVQLSGRAARSGAAVELELSAGSSYRLVEDLVSGALDAAILPDEIRDSRLRMEKLWEDEVVLVAGRKLRKALGSGPGRRAALLRHPLVTYPRETAMRALVDRICLREGLSFESQIAVNGVDAVRMLALDGIGPAFVQGRAVREELATGELFRLDGMLKSPTRSVLLATRPSEAGERIREALTEWLASPRSSPGRT